MILQLRLAYCSHVPTYGQRRDNGIPGSSSYSMILKGHVHSFMRDRPSIRSAIQPIAARTGCGRGPAGLFTDNCGQTAPRSFLPPVEPSSPRGTAPVRPVRRTATRQRASRDVDRFSPSARRKLEKGPPRIFGRGEGGQGRAGQGRAGQGRPAAYIGGCSEGNHGRRAKLHCAESQTNDAADRDNGEIRGFMAPSGHSLPRNLPLPPLPHPIPPR